MLVMVSWELYPETKMEGFASINIPEKNQKQTSCMFQTETKEEFEC